MCGQCHLPRRLHRAPRARRGGPACPAAAGRWVCRRDSWGRLPVAYSEASEAAACTCACRWWREARKGDRQRRGAQACARVREHRQGAESALDESTPRSRGLGGILSRGRAEGIRGTIYRRHSRHYDNYSVEAEQKAFAAARSSPLSPRCPAAPGEPRPACCVARLLVASERSGARERGRWFSWVCVCVCVCVCVVCVVCVRCACARARACACACAFAPMHIHHTLMHRIMDRVYLHARIYACMHANKHAYIHAST